MSSSDPGSAPSIALKPGRESPARKRHHPWIYSQAVSEVKADPSSEGLFRVVASDNSPVGWGFYSPASLIAVRMVSFDDERPETDWAERRTHSAFLLRSAFDLDTDAMRVVNSEGDFLPGLIVDLYGDTAVVTAHVRGMEAEVDRIAARLQALVPRARIYFKRDEHYARVEGLSRPSGFVVGSGEGTCVIREGAVRLIVDFQAGQKTGFYLDQRANRRLIARSSAGQESPQPVLVHRCRGAGGRRCRRQARRIG